MLRYIAKRFVLMIPVFLGVSMISFTIISLTPGDPLLIQYGVQQTETTDFEQMRRELGLDQPAPIRYLNFLGRLLQGDLGTSIRTGRPVAVMIAEALPRTLELTAAAVIIAILVGIPAGIIAAKRQNSAFDNVSMVGSLVASASPEFWLGLVLIYIFSYQLGLTPTAGYGRPEHMILPALTLGLVLAGTLARFTRSSMLEVVRQDFIRAVRAKGVSERVVTFKHALKNALIPMITVLGIQLGSVLAGSFFIEVIFAWPGIGRLAITAIQQRDLPVVQGAVLVTSITFVLINLVIDLIYAYVDPRVRFE